MSSKRRVYHLGDKKVSTYSCDEYLNTHSTPSDPSFIEQVISSTFQFFKQVFSTLRIMVVVLFLIYSWIDNSRVRDEQFAIIHELSK